MTHTSKVLLAAVLLLLAFAVGPDRSHAWVKTCPKQAYNPFAPDYRATITAPCINTGPVDADKPGKLVLMSVQTYTKTPTGVSSFKRVSTQYVPAVSANALHSIQPPPVFGEVEHRVTYAAGSGKMVSLPTGRSLRLIRNSSITQDGKALSVRGQLAGICVSCTRNVKLVNPVTGKAVARHEVEATPAGVLNFHLRVKPNALAIGEKRWLQIQSPAHWPRSYTALPETSGWLLVRKNQNGKLKLIEHTLR